MPIEALVIGGVAFILFTFNGPLQNGDSKPLRGGSSRGSGSRMTDTELIQEAQRRGLTK
jgi:hypothetical protein